MLQTSPAIGLCVFSLYVREKLRKTLPRVSCSPCWGGATSE